MTSPRTRSAVVIAAVLSAYVLVAAYVLHRTADTPADAAAVHLLVVAGGGLLLLACGLALELAGVAFGRPYQSPFGVR